MISLNPAQVVALIAFVIVFAAVVMVIVSNTRRNR